MAVTSQHTTKALFPVSVEFNWHNQYEFAGYFAAEKQGYYQHAGIRLDLKKWESNDDVLHKVATGKVDLGVVYGSVLADYVHGAPIKLVMPSFQFSPIVFLSHHPINSWEDLKGKKIVEHGNLYLKDVLVKLKTSASQKANFTITSSSGRLQDFVDGKVDLYAGYETNEPYRLKHLGVPFHIVDPKDYGVQGYGGLLVTSNSFARAYPDIVYKFKQATIKGWQYALSHPAETVDYILANYSVKKSRAAMLNEASKTGRYVSSGDQKIGDIDNAKLLVMVSEARETGLITQAEMKNFDVDDFVFNGGQLMFTPEELAYLAKKPVIKLANDIHWGPFQFIDQQMHYKGICADYFHLLSEKTGLTFSTVKHKDWSQVVQLAKEGKLDVYPCAVPTPERKKYMRFTKPYMSFPMVLLGRQSMSYVGKYDQLNNQVVAVVKGGWSSEYLTEHFPKIRRLPVRTVKEGIQAVLDGRATAFSGNLGVINYINHQNGFTGVHVIGQSSDRFDIAIGVQKDNPVLFSILQKGLSAISEHERQEIYNKWIKLEVVNRLDKTQLWSIFVSVTAVVLSVLLLALIYRYQKNKQQEYIGQIHELTFATLIDMSSFRLIKVTESYARLTGYGKHELLGMNYLDLAANEMSDDQKHHIYSQVSNGKVWHGEMKGKSKDGEDYWVYVTFTPVTNILGKVAYASATRVDITDKKRIEKLSIIDEMTGLYNRRHFNQVVEREINRAKRQGTDLAVAMLDIDYFKNINDKYGHQVGDEVLMRIASSFKKAFHRGNDFTFRMGGEEFLVLSAFTCEEDFKNYLERFCRDIQALGIENEGSSYGVLTVSIGAVFYSSDMLENSTKLYQDVDQRLYEAKQSGRNRVVI
ncbi:diguanylate cyclase [Hydrogenovibrio sp. JE_KL2]|uniref:diguanylate cyclase n=2 Tax=Pseudomonadota TaxID=1224 RepID=UPI001561D367|nr:diguanylate cyclase [Hydrogenovibrio sp. JE_KL2]